MFWLVEVDSPTRRRQPSSPQQSWYRLGTRRQQKQLSIPFCITNELTHPKGREVVIYGLITVFLRIVRLVHNAEGRPLSTLILRRGKPMSSRGCEFLQAFGISPVAEPDECLAFILIEAIDHRARVAEIYKCQERDDVHFRTVLSVYIHPNSTRLSAASFHIFSNSKCTSKAPDAALPSGLAQVNAVPASPRRIHTC